IVMQFTAGALACAAVRKMMPSKGSRSAAGYGSALLLAAMVGVLYYFDAHPISGIYDSSGLVDVLFVPLVMALAIGTGSLPAVLSTRLMVYGGQISFALYMVHELVHTSWNWAAIQFEVVLNEGDTAAKWMVAGLLVVATVLSMLLFHGVEEPARRWMRKMSSEMGEDLGPEFHEVVDRLTDSIVSKILHDPTIGLKEGSSAERLSRAEAIKALFRIGGDR
ncbi:hypothetical protein FBQ97_12020, partial [Acidobacteria bacterium ACD]|nr:hypothetical protein [Acidobacteria bacterium ACD]